MSSIPEWLVVVILGIIEGITEFLPISSTGHMLIAEHWLPFKQSEVFLALVQCGAVLAVLTVFAGRVKELLANFNKPENRDFVFKLAVAFLITAAIGIVLKKMHFKLNENARSVAWATLVGGFLILIIEAAVARKQLRDTVTWPVAICVGAGQLLAVVFPGLSRSGATILMALAMGVARPKAAEFSFLLGIPTLLAAGVKTALDARHSGEQVNWMLIALGSAVAAITAFATVKWLLRYVQTHTFNVFGYYRILLGALILLLVR
ncbi:MAG TPA: undecaprenyl-diphosphate phosphatase [Verrucomicrobiae bacterium]